MVILSSWLGVHGILVTSGMVSTVYRRHSGLLAGKARDMIYYDNTIMLYSPNDNDFFKLACHFFMMY